MGIEPAPYHARATGSGQMVRTWGGRVFSKSNHELCAGNTVAILMKIFIGVDIRQDTRFRFLMIRVLERNSFTKGLERSC